MEASCRPRVTCTRLGVASWRTLQGVQLQRRDDHDIDSEFDMQVVIGVGLLAAVSYAVKQFVAPKVSQWYHEWRHDADKAKAEEEQQKTAQLVASAIQSQVSQAHHPTHYSASDRLTSIWCALLCHRC